MTETLTCSLTPTYASHISDYAFMGHSFELAVSQGGTPLPDFAFIQPITLTIHYSADDERLVYDSAESLVMTRSGTVWQDAAQSCDPAFAYQRDTVGRVLTIPICRTGTLALFGPTHQTALPLISRSR